MPFTILAYDYLRWHYRIAPGSLFNIWTNFLIYIVHTFSMRLHLQTLFAPWHRVQETRGKKWDLEDWAGVILVNLVSRLVGFWFRFVLLLIGGSILLALVVILPVAYLIWYTAPLFITICILGGIIILLVHVNTL